MEFMSKIKCLPFDNYKGQIEMDLNNQYYSLNQAKNQTENSINILTLRDYAYMFVKSILTFQTERKEELGSLVFNKDDDLIVDCVSSAANIRAFNFSIPMEVRINV